MWNTFRSDLKEFASSIATDGTSVLENIDSKLKENNEDDDDDERDERLLALDSEGALTASAFAATNGGTDDDTYDNSNGDNNNNGADAMTMMMSEAQDEAYRRMEMDITFITPLLKSEVNGVKDEKDENGKVIESAGKSESEIIDQQVGEGETAHVGADVDINVDDEADVDVDADADADADVDADADADADETTQLEVQALLSNEEDKDSPVSNGNNKGYEDDNDDDDDDDEDEDEIKQFLSSFDIQSKTEEISKFLAERPFLAQHFENLVPVQVTYEQFWQRFFYRCDPVRIVKEWQDEDERAKLLRKELIGKSVQSVQNIFGGALKAIKGVASKDANEGGMGTTSSIYEKYQAELEEKQKAMLLPGSGQQEKDDDVMSKKGTQNQGRRGILGGALGMFGGNGRPPFVLNTAESDDEDYEEEDVDEDEESQESEEEEELGWGSDEEEDEESDDDDQEDEYEQDDTADHNDLNDTQEIIVFEDTDATSENVIAEINNLKSMLEEAQSSKHESEIKARKLQEELDALKKETLKKENIEFVKANDDETTSAEKIINLTSQLDEAQALKDSAEARSHELMKELYSCKETIKEQSLGFANSLVAELAKVQDEHIEVVTASEAAIADLNAQLKESKTQTENFKMMSEKLKEDLDSCRDEMKKQSLTYAKTIEEKIAMVSAEPKEVTAVSSASAQEGSSLSSAVEIIPKVDEEDCWGDSWSDDDDGDDN